MPTCQPLFPAHCPWINKSSAFVLKPRVFYDYEVTLETDIIPPKVRLDTITHVGAPLLQKLTAVDNQQEMRIPRYVVQDDSYVEVFEQNKSVADAVAQSPLSEVSAELAMYVGDFLPHSLQLLSTDTQ